MRKGGIRLADENKYCTAAILNKNSYGMRKGGIRLADEKKDCTAAISNMIVMG